MQNLQNIQLLLKITIPHGFLAIMHSKNKWSNESNSLQKITFQGFWNSSFSKIISTRNFVLWKQQQKHLNLGGTFKSHTTWIKRGVTPLKLTKTYMDLDKYNPFISYDQINWSSSSDSLIVLAISTISCHCTIISSEKVLPKSYFKFVPSHGSAMVLICWFKTK
jgi:hypothetical protein